MQGLDLRPIFYLAAIGAFIGLPAIGLGMLWLLYHLACAVYYYVQFVLS